MYVNVDYPMPIRPVLPNPQVRVVAEGKMGAPLLALAFPYETEQLGFGRGEISGNHLDYAIVRFVIGVLQVCVWVDRPDIERHRFFLEIGSNQLWRGWSTPDLKLGIRPAAGANPL